MADNNTKVIFDYGSKGHDKTKAELKETKAAVDDLSTGNAGLAATAALGANAVLEIGQKALEAGKKIYEFGKAGAQAAGVGPQFSKFEDKMGSLVGRLQSSTAAALANSGAFGFIETAFETLLPPLETVLGLVENLEPVFLASGEAMKIALAPTNALMEGIGWLSDAAKTATGTVGNQTTAIEGYIEKLRDARSEMAKIKSQNLDQAFFDDAINSGFGDVTQAQIQAVATELQLVGLATSDYQTTVDGVSASVLALSENEGEARAVLAGVAAELEKRGATTFEVSQALLDTSKSIKEAIDLDNELTEGNKAVTATNKAVAASTWGIYEARKSWLDTMGESLEAVDALSSRSTAAAEAMASADKAARSAMVTAAEAQFDAEVERLEKTRKYRNDLAEYERLEREQNQEGMKNLGTGAWSMMENVLGATGTSGWWKAAMGIAEEGALALSTMFTAPWESATHVLAGVQYGVMQGIASSMPGSKKTGSSASGGGAGRTASTPKSDSGRFAAPDDGDRGSVIMVDRTVLGRVSASGINAASSAGLARIQSSAVGGKGRRGLFG
jgi:hypothetical protein